MDQRGAIWAVAGPLILFKIWVIVLLLMYAPVPDGIEGIIATQWPFVVIVLFLVAVPGLAWYRLVRVRARRAKLRRQEWMLDQPKPGAEELRDVVPTQWPLWETVSWLERDEP